MRILGIIPARYASSRFPGKPLVDIRGKSMIRRVYEQAGKADTVERVIVATDDQRIFDAVQGFGGEAVMTRAGHPNGTSRITEAIVGRSGSITHGSFAQMQPVFAQVRQQYRPVSRL